MFPPASRRGFLAQAAAVAAGGAAVGVALPLPVSAGASERVPDPIFTAIAAHQAAHLAHGNAIDAQDEADTRYGHDSDEAWEADEHCEEACHFAHDVAWQLARSVPTTLAGVVALLRFANQFEDEGNEWSSDTNGRSGWHYQLCATMAAAIEAIIRRDA